jgi:hypothetical protein
LDCRKVYAKNFPKVFAVKNGPNISVIQSATMAASKGPFSDPPDRQGHLRATVCPVRAPPDCQGQ